MAEIIKFPLQIEKQKSDSNRLDLSPEEILKRLPIDSGASGLDVFNEILSAQVDAQNNAPIKEFLGLSPNQMRQIHYSRFEFDNELFRFSCESNEQLGAPPIVTHALYIMEKIAETEGRMRATQKGNLPKAVVLEMYDKFFARDGYEYFRPGHGEEDSIEIHRTKFLLKESGFIKIRSGKFSLTQAGQKILERNNRVDLYKQLFLSFANKLNWGYFDRYPDFALIQASLVFNLLLIHKNAKQWVRGEDIGKVFFRAFPMMAEEECKSHFGQPGDDVVHSFTTRFLHRFCAPMGLVELEEEAPMASCNIRLRETNFFKDCFEFKA
ncbi:MAG: hypothetical protein H6626_01945 [Pseudobdellovibrionaceae bacterium]|nr:hypothetical protein [Bdellovibrionales bacterium]USN47875.1 MAG: hypothetical protein H6626_01945 [Pseudobdellovibrionaceae bacterium]